jgi:DNA/RNA endonuclease G (NUC1)/PKD repeat protein
MRLSSIRFATRALLVFAITACSSDRLVAPRPKIATVARDQIADVPPIVITELMPDPTKVADASGEWFEVFNAGSTPVDLQGWKILSGPGNPSETHTIASSVVVPPQTYVVLGNNSNSATNGGVTEAYSYGAAITLNNSNTDWLALKMADGTLVDSVAYSARDAGGVIVAPTFTPAAGVSRALIDLSIDNTILGGTNWRQSTITETYGLGDRGTPGTGPGGTIQPPGPVVTVNVTPSPTSVAVGQTKQFTATGVDADGRTSPTTFTWVSSATNIATIDANGLATGVAEGTTTITATSANSIVGQATLTVAAPNAPATISIAVNTPVQAPIGFVKPAFATVRDVNGTIISPPPTLVWSSSNTNIATVDQNGYITGVGVGQASIRATAPNNVFGSTNFSVIAATAPTTAIYRNHLEFGTPTDGNPSDDFILTKPQYVLSYSAARGEPNWVSWNLNATQFGGAPRCDCFSSDQTLPANFYHVVDFDYRNGGYDRGHMVQSESRTTTDQENASTFLLTNIVPQGAENNQGPWSQFENFLNDQVRSNGKEIYVIAGPEFGPSPGTLKGEGHVAIPDYTWKIAVILAAGKGLADVRSTADLQVIAIKMPNLVTPGGPASSVGIRNNPWQQYQTTVGALQNETGYDFLSALPDDIEKLVENNDRAPVANAGGPYAASEGAAITFDGGGSSDPDGDALTLAWDFGDGSTGTGKNPQHAYADNGQFTVTLTVSDPVGAKASATVTAAITNVAPTATFVASASVVEGQAIALSLANATDASTVDRATLQFAFDCGTGGGYGAASATPNANCPTTDNGVRTVKARVSDKDGGATEYSATVQIGNAPPVITALVVPAVPSAVGSVVQVSVSFTDPGADAHQTTIDWGDGQTSVVGGDGTVSATHSYAAAGLYVVSATVRDDDGGQASLTSDQRIVVYDPAGGFVTGGGWINSAPGAFVSDPSAQGKAHFGVTMKYHAGDTTPSGETSFTLKEAGLDFASTSVDWLVVNGSRATYSGSGTIQGRAGTYRFVLTAIDGKLAGDGIDRLRVKITDGAGAVVYDNVPGAADDAAVGQSLGGGSISVKER